MGDGDGGPGRGPGAGKQAIEEKAHPKETGHQRDHFRDKSLARVCDESRRSERDGDQGCARDK